MNSLFFIFSVYLKFSPFLSSNYYQIVKSSITIKKCKAIFLNACLYLLQFTQFWAIAPKLCILLYGGNLERGNKDENNYNNFQINSFGWSQRGGMNTFA